MENVSEKIVQLIRSEVCGGTLSSFCNSSFSESDLAALYSASKNHNMSHIISSALLSNNLLSGSSLENVCREQIYMTLYRYESQCYILEKVCNVLEKEKIPYIPLKGSVIKDMYPQPWMRTGCDIDILVSKNDVRKAADAITQALGYEEKGRGKHDIQILSSENIYVELHFSLLEESVSPSMAKVLDRVWEYAAPAEEGQYRYVLSDEMFYFYHIAHMAKHFLSGGCGIRPFLDLWIMGRNEKYNTAEVASLLKKAKLTDFEKTVSRLSRVWFSGEEHDRLTRLMGEFIFNGGCFGSRETKMLSEQQKSGGRTEYMLSRIFVPYDELKKQYPLIIKFKFLTPFCEICRLLSLLFGKKRKFRKTYLGNLKNVSEEHIDDINYLFERVGLS